MVLGYSSLITDWLPFQGLTKHWQLEWSMRRVNGRVTDRRVTVLWVIQTVQERTGFFSSPCEQEKPFKYLTVESDLWWIGDWDIHACTLEIEEVHVYVQVNRLWTTPERYNLAYTDLLCILKSGKCWPLTDALRLFFFLFLIKFIFHDFYWSVIRITITKFLKKTQKTYAILTWAQ